MDNNLEQKIEAILFFKNEPVKFTFLEKFLEKSKKEIMEAIANLRKNLLNRGITLIEKEGAVMLSTAKEFSFLIEELQKEELSKNLSKASLETLSIILYKNGANRAEIDYIRGVNSNFTLRALSVRGLIEKTIDPKDNRRYIYKPTFQLLSYMGLNSIEDLTDYQKVTNELKNINQEKEND